MKNVLNYFVRKAFGFKSTATAEDKTLFGHLLRIRQNIQGVYDWLYGRLSGSVDGTVLKRMPMTEAVTSADGHEVHIAKAWNSDNLLAHLRLLDGRKISNGYADGRPADDGLPDGVSLARLLCDSTTQPTALIDDNVGWVASVDGGVRMMTAFPNAKSVVLGCKVAQGRLFTGNNLEHISLPNLEVQEDGHLIEGNLPNIEDLTIDVVHIKSTGNWTQSILRSNSITKILRLPRLKYMTNNIGQTTGLDSSKLLVYGCSGVEEIYAPNLEEFRSNQNGAGGIASTAPNLRKVVVGDIRIWHCQYAGPYFFDNFLNTKYDNLLHLEFKSLNCSLDLRNWTAGNVVSDPLFLDNFLHFIAERVAEGNYTLTLSSAVFSSIWDADGNPAVIGDGHDELRAAINTELIYNKHWNVNKA